MKKFHLSISVSYCVRQVKHAKLDGRKQDVVSEDGVLLDNETALKELQKLKSEGMAYMPCGDCDNYDDTGRCQGHND